jgi:putative ABC transport system ATP-binding protein
VLHELSVGVREYEILAVTGPSGSGKTALLACLAGVCVPDSGEVWFNSSPVHTLSTRERADLRRSRFGWIDGRARLLPELTVAENVALPLLLAGVRRAEAFAAARHWLERLDVAEPGGARPGGLPLAVVRRIAVARALLTYPAVLFADDPARGLDTPGTEHLMRITASAVRSHGMTLVLATSDDRVAAHADRTFPLRDGRPAPAESKAPQATGSPPSPPPSFLASSPASPPAAVPSPPPPPEPAVTPAPGGSAAPDRTVPDRPRAST